MEVDCGETASFIVETYTFLSMASMEEARQNS
jgi:hypothetical protein